MKPFVRGSKYSKRKSTDVFKNVSYFFDGVKVVSYIVLIASILSISYPCNFSMVYKNYSLASKVVSYVLFRVFTMCTKFPVTER